MDNCAFKSSRLSVKIVEDTQDLEVASSRHLIFVFSLFLGFKILEESFNPEYSPENSFLGR